LRGAGHASFFIFREADTSGDYRAAPSSFPLSLCAVAVQRAVHLLSVLTLAKEDPLLSKNIFSHNCQYPIHTWDKPVLFLIPLNRSLRFKIEVLKRALRRAGLDVDKEDYQQ
jgi:hypothetical protein